MPCPRNSTTPQPTKKPRERADDIAREEADEVAKEQADEAYDEAYRDAYEEAYRRAYAEEIQIRRLTRDGGPRRASVVRRRY